MQNYPKGLFVRVHSFDSSFKWKQPLAVNIDRCDETTKTGFLLQLATATNYKISITPASAVPQVLAYPFKLVDHAQFDTAIASAIILGQILCDRQT